MKVLTIGFTAALFFATCTTAFAEGKYEDYVEAFSTNDNAMFYVYKPSIAWKDKVVSFEVLEVKSRIEKPSIEKGIPYIAVRFKFKFACGKNQYTEAPTAIMGVEDGWGKFSQERIRKDDSIWRALPADGSFSSAMYQTFCK